MVCIRLSLTQYLVKRSKQNYNMIQKINKPSIMHAFAVMWFLLLIDR